MRNWEDMEHLWNFTFHDKMGIQVKVRPPLLPALAGWLGRAHCLDAVGAGTDGLALAQGYGSGGLDPLDQKILLTEAPLNPKTNREKTVETMFEKYSFGALQVQTQAMLTLYAQGAPRVTSPLLLSCLTQRPIPYPQASSPAWWWTAGTA